jgi:hypothetical protein
MTVYLTIITTLLVITQIIRVTQNAIQLRRQEGKIKETLDWFERQDISEQDFVVQRECFYMLHDWLVDQKLKKHKSNAYSDSVTTRNEDR